jgi:hypothetical protein
VPLRACRATDARRRPGLRNRAVDAHGNDDELERELRVDVLEDVPLRVLGDRTVPMLVGYRVRIGVR